MAKRVDWTEGRTICVLDDHETVLNQCDAGDAAVKFEEGVGWWVYFVGADGEVNGWDDPYATADEAVTAIIAG